MSKKLNVAIGQEIWVKPLGNAARRDKSPRPGIVCKVGNKYFNVKFSGAIGGVAKFHLFNGLQVSNYTADWKVYLTEQEIDDEDEWLLLNKNIGLEFHYGAGTPKLPLETLRQINALIVAAREEKK